MKTIDDVLERIKTSYAFTQEEIKEFMEANKDKVASGWDYCDEHGIDFFDISDMFSDSLKDRAEICDISVQLDDYGDYMAVSEDDDLTEAFKDCRKDLEFDIPYYIDGNNVIPLPFIQYRGTKGDKELHTCDFADAYAVWCEPVGKNRYDYVYTYNYDHDEVEEWWDEGEGSFSVSIDCGFTKKDGDDFLREFTEQIDLYRHCEEVKENIEKIGIGETYTDMKYPIGVQKDKKYAEWLNDVSIKFTKKSDKETAFEICRNDKSLIRSYDFLFETSKIYEIYREYINDYAVKENEEEYIYLKGIYCEYKQNEEKKREEERKER